MNYHAASYGVSRIQNTVHYREKWQMALDLIGQARSDGAPHRAVVADGWYGEITDYKLE
jgi:hypothetical protein